jgi:hypothetical protein
MGKVQLGGGRARETRHWLPQNGITWKSSSRYAYLLMPALERQVLASPFTSWIGNLWLCDGTQERR